MGCQYSVVVMGCDEYYDIANINGIFLNRYWNNESKKIYVTETILPNVNNFDVEISTEKNMKWSSRLMLALEHITTPYVILLCDDFFISESVSFERIDKLTAICQKNDLGCLKLLPAADPYEFINEELGNSKNGIYRISTMPAIWEIDYLRQIAQLDVNAWDFELKGSQYSVKLSKDVWCTTRPEITFVHAINKGKWEYEAIKLFKKEVIPEALYSKRETQSIIKYLYRELGGYIYRHFPKVYKEIRDIIKNEG